MSLPPLRHLDYGRHATVEDMGAAGVQALLDGGDVAAWRPLLIAVAREPWGSVATRLEHVLAHLESYGTATAVDTWLRRCRAGAAQRPTSLAQLRGEAGLTQRELASRLGVSQAQVARLESTSTPSVRSLTRYLGVLDMAPVAVLVATTRGGHLVSLGAAPPQEPPVSPHRVQSPSEAESAGLVADFEHGLLGAFVHDTPLIGGGDDPEAVLGAKLTSVSVHSQDDLA